MGLSGPGTTKLSKDAFRYSGGICDRSSIRSARPSNRQSHGLAPESVAFSTMMKPVPPHFGQVESVAIGSIIGQMDSRDEGSFQTRWAKSDQLLILVRSERQL